MFVACGFFFSSRRRHTRSKRDWSSDVCSSDLQHALVGIGNALAHEVFAGDAEMHGAARQLRGDLACREIGDLDIVEAGDGEIGRASCRERVWIAVGAGGVKKGCTGSVSISERS